MTSTSSLVLGLTPTAELTNSTLIPLCPIGKRSHLGTTPDYRLPSSSIPHQRLGRRDPFSPRLERGVHQPQSYTDTRYTGGIHW